MRNALYLAALVLMSQACSRAATAPQHVPSIPLHVEGRIDHMAWDATAKRLWIAALGNDTVEVLDMPNFALIIQGAGPAAPAVRQIKDMHKPQGIAAVPDYQLVAVASGDDGTLKLFDSSSLKLVRTVKVGDDADNVRYDPAAKRLYVGWGSGAIAVVDPSNGKKLADIKLDGHPESFQLETAGPRIFVNVPDAHQVAVIDRTKQAVVNTWNLEDSANFPMALDEVNHRLIIVCRKPAKMLALDTANGKVVASVGCAGDCDDAFYDAPTRRIYISCGEGFIDTFAQDDADHYRQVNRIATAPGARTSRYLPVPRMLLLAVPHRGEQQSELRLYQMP